MFRHSAAAFAVMLVAAACAPPAGGPPAGPPASPGGPVPFQPLATGQVARYDRPQPMLSVLADASAFARWWSDAVGQGDPVAVSRSVAFGQEIIIGVLQGQRTTGGYGVEVREARQQGATIVVVVETHAPSPGALVPQVITSPYQVIKVKVGNLPNWRQLHYVMQASDGTVLAETDI